MGTGDGVQGFGFRVKGPRSRARVQGPGFGFRVKGPRSRVQGPGFGLRVKGSRSRVQGPGFGFRVLEFGVTGLGFIVQSWRVKVWGVGLRGGFGYVWS